MNINDINEVYTSIIRSYLKDGYMINAETMTGTEGKISKIDLQKDGEIIRVLLEQFNEYQERYSYEGVRIAIGSYDDPKHIRYDFLDTLWNNRMCQIGEYKYYKLGEDRLHGTFYGTKEDAKFAEDIRLTRYILRNPIRETKSFGPEAISIGHQIVQNKLGFRRVIDRDITISKYKNVYTVGYHEKSYRLR